MDCRTDTYYYYKVIAATVRAMFIVTDVRRMPFLIQTVSRATDECGVRFALLGKPRVKCKDAKEHVREMILQENGSRKYF